MPTIKLTDQLGLDFDLQPAPASALLKYVQQLPSLRLDALDLAKVGGLTLDQPAVQSLSTGVTFNAPLAFAEGGPAVSVSAGAHASLRLIADEKDLPTDDGSVELAPDGCYVSFGIDATASANVAASAAGVQFGASPSTAVELVSYARFATKSGVTLLDAVKQAVASFSVPVRASDLADLPAGQITKVTVQGKLTFSGSVDLLTVANPLASVSLPAPLPAVSVSAGGSAAVGVSCEVETEYEIVARKLNNGTVRLGWRNSKAAGVSVRARVSEGISAGVGGGDLFSQVVGAISANAQADLKELASAGVPDKQAADIQSAVKAAAARKLEIAVAGELSASASDAAAFLYEIAPAELTDESRQAIDRALRGDLTGLHASALSGISCVRSAWENIRKRGLEFEVNLLGILNYRSIATLSLEGEVLYEPATGSLTIADRATAERIRSTQINYGADTEKLRHVLAESFLITAAYLGAKQIVGPVSLRCSHSFFELQNSTTRADVTRKLRTGVALGLLQAAEAEPPAAVADFGRTLFSAATNYDDELVERMFLDAAGNPLPPETYEAAGRYAIQFLVQPNDADAVRRKPAIDDGLWDRMKESGQPGIAALFPGVPAPLAGAITADYSTIQWWAEAMHGAAKQLAAMRAWLERNPNATVNDSEYQKQRHALAAYLRDVAANTREEFGQPWGLIAMNRLAARRAGAKMLLLATALTLNKSRALAAATRP